MGSVVVARGLYSAGSVVVVHGLSCSAWDLPGPGLEPVSPALAGGFLTTAPPGKPRTMFLKMLWSKIKLERVTVLGWA